MFPKIPPHQAGESGNECQLSSWPPKKFMRGTKVYCNGLEDTNAVQTSPLSSLENEIVIQLPDICQNCKSAYIDTVVHFSLSPFIVNREYLEET
jgi:hypothetical protein